MWQRWISEGSNAAYAYCIGNHNSINRVKGGARCTSARKISSLRLEMYGALCVAIVIRGIAPSYKINTNDANYHCYIYNNEVVKRRNGEHDKGLRKYTMPEYETYEELEYQINASGINGKWWWIPSHHKDTSQAGLLNTEVDQISGEIRVNHESPTQPTYLPHITATIMLNNNILSADISQQVLFHEADHNLKTYLSNKYEWNEPTFKDISWEAYASALQKMKWESAKTLRKITNEWNAVGTRVKK